jgi:hypothetical protein
MGGSSVLPTQESAMATPIAEARLCSNIVVNRFEEREQQVPV